MREQTFTLVGDGGWTEWDESETCSKTCGEGTKTRRRTCTNPSPALGGADCPGDAEETVSCNIKPCPGRTLSEILTNPILKG